LLSLEANDGVTDNAVVPFAYGVEDIAFTDEGHTLSSVSSDGTFRTWDSQTGELLTDMNLGEKILAAAFSPDGSQLVYTTYSPDEQPPTLIYLSEMTQNN
jgi:WD40 repeat protein